MHESATARCRSLRVSCVRMHDVWPRDWDPRARGVVAVHAGLTDVGSDILSFI